MPWPLSAIWRDLRPPSRSVSLMDVEPASREFSRSSLIAFEGRWMIWQESVQQIRSRSWA